MFDCHHKLIRYVSHRLIYGGLDGYLRTALASHRSVSSHSRAGWVYERGKQEPPLRRSSSKGSFNVTLYGVVFPRRLVSSFIELKKKIQHDMLNFFSETPLA